MGVGGARGPENQAPLSDINCVRRACAFYALLLLLLLLLRCYVPVLLHKYNRARSCDYLCSPFCCYPRLASG